MNKCIKCNKEEIKIIKDQLCIKCYRKEYRNKNYPIGNGGNKKVKFPSEKEFVKNYFKHNNWIHNPVTFKLDGQTYSPDFYDQETNTFIEVINSVNTYYHNKEKYSKVLKLFPKIKFEIRNVRGDLVYLYNEYIKY